MFYVVNKLVGAVLSPLAIGIGLMAVSVLLAAPPNGGGRRNLKWWGMGVGVFAVLWFWVWGTQVMMTIFALPLETDFPVVKAEDSPVADAIVVLGGRYDGGEFEQLSSDAIRETLGTPDEHFVDTSWIKRNVNI